MKADAYKKCHDDKDFCIEILDDSRSTIANSLVNYYYNWEPYSNTAIDQLKITPKKKKTIEGLVNKMINVVTAKDNYDEFYEYADLYYKYSIMKEEEVLMAEELKKLQMLEMRHEAWISA